MSGPQRGVARQPKRVVRNFKGDTLGNLHDQDTATVFEGFNFEDCTFEHFGLSITQAPDLMTTVRNVTLTNCTVIPGHIGPCIFENVIVDTLKCRDMIVLHKPLLRHVVLKGRIGRLVIGRHASLAYSSKVVEKDFAASGKVFYKSVDWALDITQAKFVEVEIEGVPGTLIRRDPETQILVTRKKLLKSDWAKALEGYDFLMFVLKEFLLSGDKDEVLAAPLAARKKEERDTMLAGFKVLRRHGLCE